MGADSKSLSYGEHLQAADAPHFVESFDRIIAAEATCIERRRAEQGRPAGGPEGKPRYNGLAISGGGIRSAAFGLGALQALHENGVLGRIDYLSTVSGGGYIGSSMICGQDASGGEFPFRARADDKSDNLAVGHIRNYSNYLIPHGFSDILANVAVIARGLAANLVVVACVILVAAGLTLLMNPNRELLDRADLFGWHGFPGHPAALDDAQWRRLVAGRAEIADLRKTLEPYDARAEAKTATLEELQRRQELMDQLGARAKALATLEASARPTDFFFTRLLLLLTVLGHAAWALSRIFRGESAAEFVGTGARIAQASLAAVVVSAILELQPFALRALYDLYVREGSGNVIGWVSQAAALVMPYLAPLAAVAAFASRLFGETLKSAQSAGGATGLAVRLAAKAVPVIIAMALPLTIWVIYLYVTIAGDIGFSYRPAWMQGLVGAVCGAPDVGTLIGRDTAGACASTYLIATSYTVLGSLGFAVTWWFLTPNGNSLHRLYRDRLSKAFLFDPTVMRRMRSAEVETGDPPSLDRRRMSELRMDRTPLHIVNAALNIQGSAYANKRGRNADFFQFSPLYSGSASTGYIRTDRLEAQPTGPDLATAMAISGAAASSNMGANTVWGFAPTLALLNIRLGYWMINPRKVPEAGDGSPSPFRHLATAGGAPLWRRLVVDLKLYLLQEVLGLLDEKSQRVYLTDGGHIENLGLYALLRRRCAVIVVLDAEADPRLAFRSLVELERFARIDLGIRIELPWRDIRASSLAVDKEIAEGTRPGAEAIESRTHVAIGRILYGPEEEGTLIYVKSSLTGDENDYIMNYRARHPAFPHETTGDQFFGEEQFECYRALGFHAAQGVRLHEAVPIPDEATPVLRPVPERRARDKAGPPDIAAMRSGTGRDDA